MSYWTNGIATLFHADAREIPLGDQSVHMVCTSPPYYGLRVYRAGDGAIGMEQTPDEYLDAMMEVFDEVWRVLRNDGICWVNLGDSYGGSWGNYGARNGQQRVQSEQRYPRPAYEEHTERPGTSYQTSGQLLGIPWRFALRMQERGWILRSDVIWAKSAPMPESLAGTRWERCRVKVANGATPRRGDAELTGISNNHHDDRGLAQWADCPSCDKCKPNGGYVLRNGSWRCTSSYEHIFQFVKQMGYYSDGEAVKTSVMESSLARVAQNGGHPVWEGNRERSSTQSPQTLDINRMVPQSGSANRRDVWRDIKPENLGSKFEHYATYPSDLPRICIQASTSEYGVCSVCGAQWARVSPSETKTLDWKPTCTCKRATWARPVVLDPFVGTGTTLLAAMRLGRQSYGVDLSEDYLKQAVKRLSNETLPMRFA